MRPQITEQTSRFDFSEIGGLQQYAEAQERRRSQYRNRVNAATRLVTDVGLGRTDPQFLKEAWNPSRPYMLAEMERRYPGLMVREAPIGGMSISDFSILTIDVLDRVLYGYYNATPVVSMPLVKRHPLRDFRLVSRYEMDGAVDPPALVAPGAEPKEKVLGPQTLIQYQPAKYEAFTRVVWEAMVNDDLGVFNDLAQRLVIGHNRGIELFITGLYVDTAGPNVLLYNSTFTNLITTTYGASTNNPPLSIQGLQDAYTVLARMLDPSGYPIVQTGTPILWYGPALKATAENLMNMLSAQMSVTGGTANAQGFPSQFIEVRNWAIQGLQPLMNPFIRLVCTTSGVQDTMWGITMDPNAQNRPSLEFGFLNGYDSPQVFMKAPNTMRPGGGLDPSVGDFYTMAHEIKALSVYGGKQIDGRSTVASKGTGTA